MGCGCAKGLGESMNTYMGPVPPGVPNPYGPMLHSYPTRYHGPIYTRPMYDLPWRERPNDFAIDPGLMGLGDDATTGEPQYGKLALVAGLFAVGVWAMFWGPLKGYR